jgi:hypothetical protein
MQQLNRYFERADTKYLLEQTIKLMQFCWDEGFGKRLGCSILEILMYECEARGVEFIPKDEGMIVRLKPQKPIKADEVRDIGIDRGRWDG